MRSVAVVSAVAGGLWWLAPVTPAVAAPDPGPSRVCQFVAVPDTLVGGSRWVGFVGGGPLPLGDDTDPTVIYSGSITCTIQVGANATHAGTDTLKVTGPTTLAVAVLPETWMSYQATLDEDVYLCAQVDIEGHGSRYWTTGTWSLDVNSACVPAVNLLFMSTAIVITA